MNKEYIEKRVKELGHWFIALDLDGVITAPKSASNIGVWESIKNNFLPESLEGMTILDAGCNAGIYSIQCALLGAKVIAIEKNEPYFSQALFLKEYYEDKFKKPLDITFIKEDFINVNWEELGQFDYILALLVLYHIGKDQWGKFSPKALEAQTKVLESWSKITKNIIVRSNSSGGDVKANHAYDEVLSRLGFIKNENEILEVVRKISLYTKE